MHRSDPNNAWNWAVQTRITSWHKHQLPHTWNHDLSYKTHNYLNLTTSNVSAADSQVPNNENQRKLKKTEIKSTVPSLLQTKIKIN